MMVSRCMALAGPGATSLVAGGGPRPFGRRQPPPSYLSTARAATPRPPHHPGSPTRAREGGVGGKGGGRPSHRRLASAPAEGGGGLSKAFSPASDDPQMTFVGKWVRMRGCSEGAVEYLMAHGMERDQAEERSNAKYEQEWLPTGEEEGEWKVITNSYKGSRTLVYLLGEWEEPFAGGSDLFGKEGGVVYRNTSWEETGTLGYVHLTESATPLGWEAAQRHVAPEGAAGAAGPVMVVRRMFTPRNEDGSAGDVITSTEYFERSLLWAPSA